MLLISLDTNILICGGPHSWWTSDQQEKKERVTKSLYVADEQEWRQPSGRQTLVNQMFIQNIRNI